MAKVHLYEVSLKKADISKQVKNSGAAKKKLNKSFRHVAEQKIKKAGLMAEFSYVCMRTPETAQGSTHHVYASPQAIGIIRQIDSVKKIERTMVSPHALTKTL